MAKKRAEPYNKIGGELPDMRAQAVELVASPVVQKIHAYILVNNRAEGNAPLTAQALIDACIAVPVTRLETDEAAL